jgi:hypothetical protein
VWCCRSAYNEQVLLGQVLTKKMDEDPSERARREQEEAADSVDISTSRKFASAVQTALGGDDEDDGNMSLRTNADGSKYGKLLNMDFMKAAAAKQKEKALMEAQGVLRQLRELEAGEPSDDEDEDSNRKRNAPFKSAATPSASAATLAQKSNAEEVNAARSNVDRLLASKHGSSFSMTNAKVSAPASWHSVGAESGKAGDEEDESAAANPWLNVGLHSESSSKADRHHAGKKSGASSSKDLEKTVFVKSDSSNTGKSNNNFMFGAAVSSGTPVAFTVPASNFVGGNNSGMGVAAPPTAAVNNQSSPGSASRKKLTQEKTQVRTARCFFVCCWPFFKTVFILSTCRVTSFS